MIESDLTMDQAKIIVSLYLLSQKAEIDVSAFCDFFGDKSYTPNEHYSFATVRRLIFDKLSREDIQLRNDSLEEIELNLWRSLNRFEGKIASIELFNEERIEFDPNLGPYVYKFPVYEPMPYPSDYESARRRKEELDEFLRQDMAFERNEEARLFAENKANRQRHQDEVRNKIREALTSEVTKQKTDIERIRILTSQIDCLIGLLTEEVLNSWIFLGS